MPEPHADHHRFGGATVTILKATKKPMKIPHTPYSQIHVICTRCTEPGAEVGFCLCPTSATLHCSLNKNNKIMPPFSSTPQHQDRSTAQFTTSACDVTPLVCLQLRGPGAKLFQPLTAGPCVNSPLCFLSLWMYKGHNI